MISKIIITIIRAYKLLLSPSIGMHCRFTPTCSTYALQAVQMHGALNGSYLTMKRILKCNPLCKGGCDPVPLERPFSLKSSK